MGDSAARIPAVSVVMPVYNQEPYVELAVSSLLQQTFTDFELVVIDDGSTDASLKILERLAAADPRVRLFSQENRGRSATRNRGLELARADLVAMMDPDDISLPERLELQVAYMREHPECVALGAQFESVCMEGLPLHSSELPLDHDSIENLLLEDNGQTLHQSVCVLRRGVCIEVGGYDEQYPAGEDVDLFLRLALKGKLANLPQVLLKYRQHPKSTANIAGRPEYAMSRERIGRAWEARSKSLSADFKHWTETTPQLTERQLLLRWGWSAFMQNELSISKRYGMRLLRQNPFDLEVWRLMFCIMRGR